MRLSAIESCRGLAALLVLFSHARLIHETAPKIFNCGYAGVDFFFVLSGFIITFAHRGDIGRPEQVFRFAKKRLLRIYPVYLAVMAILVPALYLVPSLSRADKQDSWFVVKSVVLWPQSIPPLLGVSWSLSYEMAFYTAFAFLILRRTAGIVLMLAWALFVLVSIPFQQSFWLDWFANPQVLEFFLGIGVAWAVVQVPAVSWRRFAIAGGALFGFMAWYDTYIWHRPNALWSFIFAVAAALLIYGLASGELAGQIKPAPIWLVGLGAASYSVYLVHYPILVFFAKVFHRFPETLVYWAAIPVAIAIGVLFHMWVELPLNRLLRDRLSRA